MINKILRFLILNIKDRKIVDKFKKLKKSQFLSKENLVKPQLANLNEILNHAYKNVPYYTGLLKEAGLVVNNKVELTNIDDLNRIPFLTKDIIREQKNNLHSSDIATRKAYRNTSGGSTGEPVVFMQDVEYRVSNLANTYLAKSWRGAELYDDTVVLWGAERDVFAEKKTYKQRVKDYCLNTLRLNTFVLSEDVMEQYINVLNKRKPMLIIAYIQSIYEIARFAREKNKDVKPQKAIHAAAGTVYPFMRKEIEAVFGCKVFNHYGSREAGAIASECSSHKGLHIMMEHNLVEVIDESGNQCQAGEEGDIVITGLSNYSMPLIRYKIGDRGVRASQSDCECQCHYPKLASITGRVTDLFKTAEGSMVDGEFFTHLFYFIDGIKLFQVVQVEIDKIVVKIVKISDIKTEALTDIINKVQSVMGENCVVEFQYVDDIAKTATGKYLYTISDI